jgi:heme oxygenase
MSTMTELRLATWQSHQALERRLDVKARFSTVAAYRAHLEKMWGFCAALERRFRHDLFDEALPDFEARRKTPLLMRDLLTLGAAAPAVLQLPQCATLPACADPAEALGCAYVIEGATLGGRSLLPLVEKQLGFTAAHGAAFLSSYGADTPSMWRGFQAALDRWCALPERGRSATRSAVATFDALSVWLCGCAA